MPNIKRVEMPGGNWWDIDCNPKWGALKAVKGDSSDEELLARITPAWSFPEPITAETILTIRETTDVVAALEVLYQVVLPLLDPLLKARQRPSTVPSGTERLL